MRRDSLKSVTTLFLNFFAAALSPSCSLDEARAESGSARKGAIEGEIVKHRSAYRRPWISQRFIQATALVLPFLAACSSGPDYRRPDLETPAAYKEAGPWKAGEPRDHQPRGKWWEVFGDVTLNTLQDQVEISNHTLHIAEAQYRQALAASQSARAGLFPALSATLSASRNEAAGNQAAKSGAVGSGPVNSRSLGVAASWEVDVWGRVQRLAEAGEASAAASAADLEAARLSAHALLAQNYFLLRMNERQARLLEETAAAYEKSLQLTRNRYAAGIATGLDVAQAEAQYQTTRAQTIDLGIQRAQLEHAIALLVGTAPGDFTLRSEEFLPRLLAVPPGLPSALLERRPDIAAAERRVMAANASYGAASAAFFPILTLSATGGFQSDRLSNWFTLPSRYWSLGPSLAQSLFDAGLRRAQSEQALAAYDASVASYRQTVLSGFQEVEDQLAALRLLEQEAREQDAAVKAARQAEKLALNQYQAGTVSYLNVVTAQAAALASERSAADILTRRLTASVALVKGLGGGW
ncbi:MAG: efflux transporter outer membrane subunit [Sulfuricella sp.]|nr:efflux transporter outer membrane subunit [Sulfuricella sp.]